jgi:hypothetical protein
MDVIGQDADCDGFKGVPTPNACIGVAQAVDFAHQEVARPVGERKRKEVGATGNFEALVVRHSDQGIGGS